MIRAPLIRGMQKSVDYTHAKVVLQQQREEIVQKQRKFLFGVSKSLKRRIKESLSNKKIPW